jgi:hypothetical protein
MKINRLALMIVPFVLLRGCAAVPPPRVQQPPPPQTAQGPKPYYLPPQSAQPPAPAPPLTRPVAAGWRDAAQTPGAWTFAQEASGSAARFGLPGAAPLLVMRCERARPAVVIQRQSLGSGTLPAGITTSTGARRLSAAPVGGSPMAQNAPILFEIALAPSDPLLDSMAFSRGRFMVEMSSAPTLVLPAWAEIGRVIEDCR